MAALLPGEPVAAVAETPLDDACWRHPRPGMQCWRFELASEPSGGAWLLVSVRRVGALAQVGVWTPLPDGGLSYFLARPRWEHSQTERFVQTFSATHGSFGLVSLSRARLRVVRRVVEDFTAELEMVHTVFGPIGPDGRRPLAKLPRRVTGMEAGPELGRQGPGLPEVDPEAGPEAAGVPLPAGLQHGAHLLITDWELDRARHDVVLLAGRLLGGEGSGDPRVADPSAEPGLRLVNTFRTEPYLDLLITYEKSAAFPDGRILSVDFCTEVEVHHLIQRLIVSRSSGWFRSRTRLRLVREELKLDRSECRILLPLEPTLPLPPPPGGLR